MKIQMKNIRPYLRSRMIHYLYIFSWLRIFQYALFINEPFHLFLCGKIFFLCFCGTIHFLFLWNDPFFGFADRSIFIFCGTINLHLLWNNPFYNLFPPCQLDLVLQYVLECTQLLPPLQFFQFSNYQSHWFFL
jgi:hypothetical protein